MADFDNLTIEITAQASEAINTLKALTSALNEVNDAMNRFDPNRMRDFASNMSDANRVMEEMSRNTGAIRELATAVNNATQQFTNMANANNAAQGLANNLQRVEQEANRTATALGNVRREAAGGSIFGNMSNHISTFLGSVTNATSYLKAMMKVVKGFFSTLTAPIRLATKAMSKFGQSSNVATTSAKKLVKELTRVGKMLKLMVTRMALRAVIKEVGNGFKSLALHSEEFNRSVSGMMNGAKKLGYSFAAMVSPLLNALAPAIQYVISLLVKLMNVINQVFASLTGATTFNKSKDFAEDWASNIQAANKEAKKLKKTVLGFDELNQLQEKTSGGDTSSNIVDMFETADIDPKWKKFADWLKEMWELGDFTKLGTKIGKGLRDLLESIPWTQIRKTANKLGGALATLINGFVEVERLGYDIGKTISQSINTVFEFINGFVHKLHWDSIGKFIADTFNGFFENIDWKLIKDTVETGMKGLAETLQNFIDEFRWDNISDFVINGIDVITSGVKDFIDGVDWGDLGVKIGDQLNKIMEGVDWKSVGETLGSVVESAIDWAYGLVATFSVDDAVTAIENFLNGVCEIVDFEKAGAILGTALDKLITVIEDFWSKEENRDKIKQAIFDFFDGIFSNMTEKDWDFIAKTAGILALIGALKGAIAGTNAGVTVTISVITAYYGFKLGSWIGEILTGDPSYKEYTIPVIVQWTIENFPDTWDDFLEKLNEAVKAWGDLLNHANAFVQIISNNMFLTGWLTPFAKLTGLTNDLLDSDMYKNAQQEASSYESQLNSLISDYAQGIITTDEYTKKLSQLEEANRKASEAVGKHAEENQKAEDSAKRTATIYGQGEIVAKRYAGELSGLSDKQKEIAGIVPNLSENADKLNTNTDKLSGTTGSLNDALNKADTAYKNVKTDLQNNVSYVPQFTAAQKNIIDSYLGVENETKNFDKENNVAWENFELETANANVAFAGTAGEIQKTMDDTTTDIQEQTKKISDAFSEDKWTFQGVIDGLKKTFGEAIKGIKDKWNELTQINGDVELGGGKFKIKFPKFAGGGFPKENGIFLANSSELVGRFSNGKTAVANNEQIIQGISAGVYSAVSSAMASNNNNGGYISNTIVVDGEVIARTVTKAQRKQNIRYSPVTE